MLLLQHVVWRYSILAEEAAMMNDMSYHGLPSSLLSSSTSMFRISVISDEPFGGSSFSIVVLSFRLFRRFVFQQLLKS